MQSVGEPAAGVATESEVINEWARVMSCHGMNARENRCLERHQKSVTRAGDKAPG